MKGLPKGEYYVTPYNWGANVIKAVTLALMLELLNPSKYVVLVAESHAELLEVNTLYVQMTSNVYRRNSTMLFRRRKHRLKAEYYIFVNTWEQ